MIQITVNGDNRSINENMTVMNFIETLGLKTDVMAVAINMDIVKRDNWETHIIHNGDRLELLDFVGGG